MVRVILSGDWHCGSTTTDLPELKRIARKYFRGHPVILLGDLIDCGLDKGMNFDNKYNPQEQLDRVREATANLDIRAYVIGNHEQRIFKKTSLNPYKTMFGGEPQHSVTIDGRKIYINHGKSAAENPFLEHTKYLRFVNADVVALGHSHALARITVLKGGKLVHLVRTGSFLKGEPYAVNAGLAPTIRGWAEYDTTENKVYLKGIYEGEIIDL